MPRVSQMYPSRWLSAGDLNGKDTPATIAGVSQEVVGDDNKWVLHFEDLEKGLVLNKTNTMLIATLFGDDTDDWYGGQVILFPAWVEFQGKRVQAVRIRPRPPRAVKPRPETPKPAEQSRAPWKDRKADEFQAMADEDAEVMS